MSKSRNRVALWPPKGQSWSGVTLDDANITLCQACKMSICWQGVGVCVGCASGLERPLPSKFLRQLREELACRDATVALRSIDGSGRVVHHGGVERPGRCEDNSRRADLCDTISLYALKNGWACWALAKAVRQLREPEGSDAAAIGVYKRQQPIEDDAGPMRHWCSCGNRKHESSGQSQAVLIEVTIAKLTGQPDEASAEASAGQLRASAKKRRSLKKQPVETARQLRSATRRIKASKSQPAAANGASNDKESSRALTKEKIDFAYERAMWSGATPEIFADIMWLAGPGRSHIAKESGQASKEMAKGARGSVETVLLHYFFLNNHVNTLEQGLELLLLGVYLTALDHGLVRDSDFTAFAGDLARHANLGRFTFSFIELVVQFGPSILEWHAGCISTLGLMRGLELRSWVYGVQWDVFMHYELGSEDDWQQKLPPWMCVAAALGHDVGDLCADTRLGSTDNCYFAVGAVTGYEGVAACMDILCDALEAVVLRDTRGSIDIGCIAGSACATFERSGGDLCACSDEASSPDSCEALGLLASLCRDRRIGADDAADLLGLRDSVRRRCQELPRPKRVRAAHLDHEEREQVYAEALRVMGTGESGKSAHARMQLAYSSAAKDMCGLLRRRAAYLRQCLGSGGDVLDLSGDCMCGGECSLW
ncbi:hypothetical protein MKX08_008732 [Trichoderma sp. CBMAI-0020]|nr:hypothetical protein MKX08_008732 [Trichoderma sp. CBMAI-0020]